MTQAVRKPRRRLNGVVLAGVVVFGGVAGVKIIQLSFSAFSPSTTTASSTVTLNAQQTSSASTGNATALTPDYVSPGLAPAFVGLTDQAKGLEDQIRLARALKWWQYANAEYQKTGQPQFPSAQDFLLSKYREQSAMLKQLPAGDQLSTDAATVGTWRNGVATLQDIALALSLKDPNQSPSGVVSTMGVSSSITNLHQRSVQFNQAQLDQGSPQVPGILP